MVKSSRGLFVAWDQSLDSNNISRQGKETQEPKTHANPRVGQRDEL